MSLETNLKAFKKALKSKDISNYQKRIIRKSISGIKAQERMKDLICSLIFKSGIVTADQLKQLLPMKKNGLIDIDQLKNGGADDDSALQNEVAKLKQELQNRPTQAELDNAKETITDLKARNKKLKHKVENPFSSGSIPIQK